jgi:hypothetical protein
VRVATPGGDYNWRGDYRWPEVGAGGLGEYFFRGLRFERQSPVLLAGRVALGRDGARG